MKSLVESILSSTGTGKYSYLLNHFFPIMKIEIMSKKDGRSLGSSYDEYNDASDYLKANCDIDYYKFLEDFWKQNMPLDTRLYKVMKFIAKRKDTTGTIWKPEDFEYFKKNPIFSAYKISYPDNEDLERLNIHTKYHGREYIKFEGKKFFVLIEMPYFDYSRKFYSYATFYAKENHVKTFFNATYNQDDKVFNARVTFE